MSGWGFLVDENQEPKVADRLREEGYRAEHVLEALEEGATDEGDVLPYARQEELIVLTNDIKDFKNVSTEAHSGLAILYAGDRPPHEIVSAVVTMVEAYEEHGGRDTFVYDVVDDYL